MRRALDHLINREEIIRQIQNGLGKSLSAPLWSLSQGYDQKIHPYAYDRHRAAKLLDAAGWQQQGRANAVRTGRPLKLSLLHARGSPAMAQAAQILKKELSERGHRVEDRVPPTSASSSRGALRPLRRCPCWGSPPAGGRSLGAAPLRGRLNYGRYTNPGWTRCSTRSRAAAAARGAAEHLPPAAPHPPRGLPSSVLFSPIEIMVAERRVRGLANNGRWPRW